MTTISFIAQWAFNVMASVVTLYEFARILAMAIWRKDVK